VGGGPSSPTHPEVLGIHVQLVTMQLTQLGVGGLDVVQVLHGFPKGGQHLLAVGTDLGVADDGGGAGEVPKGREEPLGPGVDDQQPRERETGAESHTGLLAQAPGTYTHTFLPTPDAHSLWLPALATSAGWPDWAQCWPRLRKAHAGR
uniref:Uncharacterized protein n=1 Tax=Chrysemys picta bellii TaxID=8478 RepID=A0A8C3IB85_CHRPI